MNRVIPAISLVIIVLVIGVVLIYNQLAGGPEGVEAERFERKAPTKVPSFGTPSTVKVDGEPMSVGHTASPELADWNNDGKPDMIVGTFRKGRIYLFLNKGSADAPVFEEGEPLKADGKILSVGAS